MSKKLTERQKETRKQARQKARDKAKIKAKIDAQKGQKPVKEIVITVEWRGRTPHAEACVHFRDGTFERREGYRAGGYGYDKCSTVVAAIFNDFLRYKLWRLRGKRLIRKVGMGWPQSMAGDGGTAPYGINSYETGRSFAGGIGTSCYPAISEHIGGKFETVAGGNTFDVFKYTDKRK